MISGLDWLWLTLLGYLLAAVICLAGYAAYHHFTDPPVMRRPAPVPAWFRRWRHRNHDRCSIYAPCRRADLDADWEAFKRAADVAFRHVANVVEDTDPDGTSEAWLRSQISRITAELGD